MLTDHVDPEKDRSDRWFVKVDTTFCTAMPRQFQKNTAKTCRYSLGVRGVGIAQ